MAISGMRIYDITRTLLLTLFLFSQLIHDHGLNAKIFQAHLPRPIEARYVRIHPLNANPCIKKARLYAFQIGK